MNATLVPGTTRYRRSLGFVGQPPSSARAMAAHADPIIHPQPKEEANWFERVLGVNVTPGSEGVGARLVAAPSYFIGATLGAVIGYNSKSKNRSMGAIAGVFVGLLGAGMFRAMGKAEW